MKKIITIRLDEEIIDKIDEIMEDKNDFMKHLTKYPKLYTRTDIITEAVEELYNNMTE